MLFEPQYVPLLLAATAALSSALPIESRSVGDEGYDITARSIGEQDNSALAARGGRRIVASRPFHLNVATMGFKRSIDDDKAYDVGSRSVPHEEDYDLAHRSQPPKPPKTSVAQNIEPPVSKDELIKKSKPSNRGRSLYEYEGEYDDMQLRGLAPEAQVLRLRGLGMEMDHD